MDYPTIETTEMREAERARAQDREQAARYALATALGYAPEAGSCDAWGPPPDVQLMEEAAALSARVAELDAEVRSLTDSRMHFRISADRQKLRCHKLRHRQRALISALENVKQSEEIEQAKFAANIGIGGWSDEELVYQSRAMRGGAA